MQIFYSRCGYKFSEAVCAFGGSSSLNLGNFVKAPTSSNGLSPSPPVKVKMTPVSLGPPPSCPPPPSAPGPPPPPPPSLSSAKSKSAGGGHVTPSDEMISLCSASYHVPVLPVTLPQLDYVPEVDMTQKKEKNNEDSGEKMFMKKELLN